MPSFILLSWWIWSLSKLSPKFWGVPTYVPTYVPPNPQQQNLPQHRSEPSPTTNPWATSPRLACASSSVEAELRSSTCWGSHLQPWVPWVPWRLVGWVLGVEACVGQHLPPTYPPKVEKKNKNLDGTWMRKISQLNFQMIHIQLWYTITFWVILEVKSPIWGDWYATLSRCFFLKLDPSWIAWTWRCFNTSWIFKKWPLPWWPYVSCGSNPDSFPYSLVELEKWQMLFPGHVPVFEDIPFYRDQIHQSTMFLDNWAMPTKPTSYMNHKIMLDQWHGILKIIACDITIGLPKKRRICLHHWTTQVYIFSQIQITTCLSDLNWTAAETTAAEQTASLLLLSNETPCLTSNFMLRWIMVRTMIMAVGVCGYVW